ncbi:MAG: chromate transporter [Clostridiales bacterium]|nr:chromate transporter [Clostridiales bacterium]
MIYLQLFWTFFKIGLFTFGGGYAMIPLISQEVVGLNWLTEAQLINYIGISEATPGPFAINIATFVGATQGGFFGAVCSTLGVVLPSFIIILLVASIFRHFEENKFVKGALRGINPVVYALIIGTGVVLLVKNFWTNAFDFSATPDFDYISLIIAAVVVAGSLVFKKVKGKNLSAIWIIVFGAVAGMVLYSI